MAASARTLTLAEPTPSPNPTPQPNPSRDPRLTLAPRYGSFIEELLSQAAFVKGAEVLPGPLGDG